MGDSQITKVDSGPETNALSELFTQVYSSTNGYPKGFEHGGYIYGVQGVKYDDNSDIQTLTVTVMGWHTFILHNPKTMLVRAQDANGYLREEDTLKFLELLSDHIR